MADDTPFHLRAECLSMAHRILSERMHMSKEVLGNDNTKFFSTEDVLKEGAKLYKFICDNDAAKNYLMSLGIPAGPIQTVSFGEERPQCQESSEACWWRNRRAHFVIRGRHNP